MRRIVYQGNYITVSEEEISGHLYERVSLRDGVHIIPYDEEKGILLIREYRVHEKGERWKFVSGWVDKKGKSLLEHAKEELAEELGLQAGKWTLLYQEKNKNATCSTSLHVYLCEEISPLKEKSKNPDSGEILEMKWFNFQDFFHLIQRGNIRNPGAFLVALVSLLQKENFFSSFLQGVKGKK